MDKYFIKLVLISSIFFILFGIEVYRMKSIKAAIKKHPISIFLFLALNLVGWAYMRSIS